jgi:CheY-like chemotaxis protein
MSSTKKVLMVDDEEQFRATTKKLLNRRGFETILAGSGEEAIEMHEDLRQFWLEAVKRPLKCLTRIPMWLSWI